MSLQKMCERCGSHNIQAIDYSEYCYCTDCNSIIEMDEKHFATQTEFEKSKQAEFQNQQTEEVVGKPSAMTTPLMVGFLPANKLGLALTSVQKNVGLRSLLEIADEIDQLLLLTDEQNSDSLALRKLKRALTRKQLVQVREEIATLQKAVQVEMGNDYWRWSWK
ncbi:hypothetical protein JP0009_17440 [Helicobacter pylori]